MSFTFVETQEELDAELVSATREITEVVAHWTANFIDQDINAEDIDELRSKLAVALETVSIKDSENAGKDAEINELKLRLQEKARRFNDGSFNHNQTMAHEFQALKSTLKSLQTELFHATSALEKGKNQEKVHQMEMVDL